MSEILRFEQVSYLYETGTAEHDALTDCSLSIHPGEKIAVMGSNGAGKSTFFLLANGVLRPTGGTIYFEGVPVGKSTRELNALRQGVGLVFQDPDVQILGGTVEEEISFGPMNLDLPREEVQSRVEKAVGNLHLEDYRTRAPQYLSGGEKKRVCIADVLAMHPKLLLLDEPASSLDFANLQLLEENLQMLEQQGLALAISTHDADFAWRWAQRILVFCGGRLAADRSPEEIFSDTELLRRCNLTQPTLYWVSQALGIVPPPRTRREFETLVSENIR